MPSLQSVINWYSLDNNNENQPASSSVLSAETRQLMFEPSEIEQLATNRRNAAREARLARWESEGRAMVHVQSGDSIQVRSK